MLFFLFGIAYLTMNNPYWAWFILVGAGAFIFGALTGKIEHGWIAEWMKADTMWGENLVIGDKP
jgi:hypothetical protein